MRSFYAVIPAGGSGTRLWPVSRAASPKFLHDLLGVGRTLLQSTWDRIEPMVAHENIYVVTGAAHAEAVKGQLPDLPAGQVLAEPSPKDSAAAIGLAAMVIAARDPEAIIGSFHADHSITNAAGFREVIGEAIEAAATGDIVTVGITPTYPATGYGYIKTGAALDIPGAPNARRARKFVEKPKAASARRYVYSGNYRWNAGMFIARADALIELLHSGAPELAAGLEAIAAACVRGEGIDPAAWEALPKDAIDYVVAEPATDADRVIVIPGDFGWDDVGDFASVASLRQPVPGESPGVVVLGEAGDVVDVAASGVVLSQHKRLIAMVGVENVVVVDTDDVLLIASRTHAQDVKRAVQAVKDLGRSDLL